MLLEKRGVRHQKFGAAAKELTTEGTAQNAISEPLQTACLEQTPRQQSTKESLVLQGSVDVPLLPIQLQNKAGVDRQDCQT